MWQISQGQFKKGRVFHSSEVWCLTQQTKQLPDTENLGSPCWEEQGVSCRLLLSLCGTLLNSIEEKENTKTDHELFLPPSRAAMCVGEGRIQNSCFSVKSHFPLDRENSPNKKITCCPVNFASRSASRGLRLAVLVELCVETIQELVEGTALHMMIIT